MTSHAFISNESGSACLGHTGTLREGKEHLAPHLVETSLACIRMGLYPLLFNGGPFQLHSTSKGVLRTISMAFTTVGHHLYTYYEDTSNRYPGEH